MAEPQPQSYHQSQTRKGNPSTSHFLLLATLVPLGATLLIVAGLILTATVIGLTVATPLFVIFSPVLLPATLVVGLSVAGFLASGAFGATSFSSFAWLAAYIRREHAKLPRLDTAGYVAQKNEEVGDSVARKAQEAQKETASKAQETDREAKKETESKNQETVGQETQKENARKSQEAGQEAQKLTGETGKAYKDNKTSL